MPGDGAVMPLVDHLAELRRRLIIVVVTLAAATAGGWAFVPAALRLLEAVAAAPLVFVAPAEALITRLRIAFALGMLLTLPVACLQAWLFVLPALFPHERRFGRIVVPLSLALFSAGLAVGFFGLFPAATRALTALVGPDAQTYLSVAEVVSFAVAMTLPMGLAFQIPLVLVALARSGIVDAPWMRKNRRAMVLLAFITAAVLTPKDVLSQALLAVPIIVLYELGLWAAARARPLEEGED